MISSALFIYLIHFKGGDMHRQINETKGEIALQSTNSATSRVGPDWNQVSDPQLSEPSLAAPSLHTIRKLALGTEPQSSARQAG